MCGQVGRFKGSPDRTHVESEGTPLSPTKTDFFSIIIIFIIIIVVPWKLSKRLHGKNGSMVGVQLCCFDTLKNFLCRSEVIYFQFSEGFTSKNDAKLTQKSGGSTFSRPSRLQRHLVRLVPGQNL